MHREIIKAPRGIQVDHKNGNGLDNRRTNLRLATASQQRANQGSHKDSKSSRFKGVLKVKKKWRAVCGRRYIGLFETETQAAIAYNDQAQVMYGQFAKLNEV